MPRLMSVDVWLGKEVHRIAILVYVCLLILGIIGGFAALYGLTGPTKFTLARVEVSMDSSAGAAAGPLGEEASEENLRPALRATGATWRARLRAALETSCIFRERRDENASP